MKKLTARIPGPTGAGSLRAVAIADATLTMHSQSWTVAHVVMSAPRSAGLRRLHRAEDVWTQFVASDTPIEQRFEPNRIFG